MSFRCGMQETNRPSKSNRVTLSAISGNMCDMFLHGPCWTSYLKDDRDPSVLLRCSDVQQEEERFLPRSAGAFSNSGCSCSGPVSSERETTPPCFVRMVVIAG